MIFESFPEKRDILHFLPPTAPLFGHFFLGFSMALGNSWHYVWPLHGGEVSSAACNSESSTKRRSPQLQKKKIGIVFDFFLSSVSHKEVVFK